MRRDSVKEILARSRLTKIDDNRIEKTDKRNGKVIFVSRITVGPDGKTMKIFTDNKLTHRTEEWIAHKR